MKRRTKKKQEKKENLKQKIASLTNGKFPKQDAFILDNSPLLSALCTRRAGKSYAAGKKLIKAALENPKSICLYIALTSASANNIMWGAVLKELDEEFKLNAHFNNAKMIMTLENGSEIRLAGADASDKEMEKFLGGKYPLIIIDEAGSFKQDLKTLIEENLEPAVSDYDGQIVMIGTPTRFTNGYFYHVTTDKEKGWSKHKWHTFDNPFMEENFRKKIAQLKERSPNIEETPMFRRMYMGEWVIDIDELVYKYDPKKNNIAHLPNRHYNYILAVDLGYNDATAYSVIAYSFEDKHCYIARSFKETHQIITKVGQRIKSLDSRYHFTRMVVDNASQQAVEELKQRWALPLIPAEKTQKIDFIELMNADFQMGLIKIVTSDCKEYVDELKKLIKADDDSKDFEHPDYDNHCCDASLYGWRHAYNYLFKEKVLEPPKTAQQEVDEWEQKEVESLQNKPEDEEFNNFTIEEMLA